MMHCLSCKITALFFVRLSLRGNGPVLASCLSHLMTDNVLRNACSVKGFIYSELRRAVNALVHTDQTFEVFQQLCYPFAKSALGEKSFKMRDFLILMKVCGESGSRQSK